MSFFDYAKVFVATILTWGMYPFTNLIYRKTKNVCKHVGTESTQLEIWKRCLFENAFDVAHYKLVLMHIQMAIFKKIKFPSSDHLYIVPFLSKSWSVNTNKVHFTDFEYAIEMLTNYKTNLVEADIVLERSIENNFEKERINLGSQERLNSLKSCIIDFLFNATPCWYMKPSIQDGRKVWDFTFDSMDQEITFAWASYDTRAVRLIQKSSHGLVEKYTDPDNWYIQIKCTKSSYDESVDSFNDNAIYCLENVVTLICHKIPSSFHSWIHFPYSDLASVWVAQKQDEVGDFKNIKDPFYKVMRYHTLATKWNCINVKSRSIATHNEFDAFESDVPAVPFVMNTSSMMRFIFDSVGDNQFWSVHPFLVEMIENPNSEYHNLPFMRIQLNSWIYCSEFVEDAWDQLKEGAGEFIDWMDRNTTDNANLNFVSDQKNIITRIIWSIGFAHAIDHNSASLVALKYDNCAAVSSPGNISLKWVNEDINKYDWCVDQILVNTVRYKNFLKVFQDMVLFKKMASWKTLDYKCPEIYDNMITFKSKINSLIMYDINEFYSSNGLDKHLTFGSLRPSEVSASINH